MIKGIIRERAIISKDNNRVIGVKFMLFGLLTISKIIYDDRSSKVN